MRKIFVFFLILTLSGCSLSSQGTCHNHTHEISATLQAGEPGTVSITDNRCAAPNLFVENNLSFSVLPDAAIQESFYHSRLYIWSLGPRQNPAEKISEIIKNKTTDNKCSVTSLPSGKSGMQLYKSDCWVLGEHTDVASEVFVAANNLIIGYRQDGADGLPPFDLASIKFVKD